MCRGRVEGHPGPMFNDYTTTKVLVADRQARYHHEAQQHRLARLVRRNRSSNPTTARQQGLGTVEPLPPAHSPEHRTAA